MWIVEDGEDQRMSVSLVHTHPWSRVERALQEVIHAGDPPKVKDSTLEV